MPDQVSSGNEFDRNKPYNSLPLLPPKCELETVSTLKATIRARSALADLKGAGRLIPNQGMLIRALILQEARLSSEIENIVTTNDEIYRALNRDQWEEHPRIKEVIRYSDALWAGVNSIKNGSPLSTRLFTEVASIIKESDMRVRKAPGTKIMNPVSGEIIYSPPEGEDLLHKLLKNLSEYYHEDASDIDPLIKLAVGHYQFEAIHPFHDGNGRTGRLTNILWLIHEGLLEQPVLYLSKTILQNKATYYAGLRGVTEKGAWEPWILYMLRAVELTAQETKVRIERIHEALNETCDLVKAKLPNTYKKELVELIYSQPYTRIQAVTEAGIAGRQTASKYLKELESIGILSSEKVAQNTLYFNEKLFHLLSA